jgi:hypothetical protein
MKTAVLLIAATLAGCALPAPKKFVGPSGRDAYMFSGCSGDSMAECYQGASALCPSGYTIVSQTSNPILATNTYTKQSIMVNDERLVVECK